MQAIDTNVVVRLIVHDDEEQGRRAEAIFRRALHAGGIWLAQVVLVETVWVLRSAYGFSRTSISSVLRTLLETARRAQALPLWTFDERLVQSEGVDRVP